jgi:hypothetical protein
MPVHAEEFRIDFINDFFDPQRVGYDRERYLRAFRDPDDTTRPLTDRIDELGLLDGQPEEVSRPLNDWVALWPQASAGEVVRLLFEALSSDPPRRVLFVYSQTAEQTVEVARADFPEDPLVVIIRGVHP